MVFDRMINFFDHPFFILLGGVSSLSLMTMALYVFYLVAKGVLPVWYRLGMSLSKNEIAIFAEADTFNNLKNVLIDSGLFWDKNIHQIESTSISRARSKALFLLHWSCFKEKIDAVLRVKKDETGLIVYAPQEEGKIEPEHIEKLNQHRNVTIVNFRGRLLQDVFVSMITTKHETYDTRST